MSSGRLGLLAVVVVVVSAIIAGLVVSGSPSEQRLLRADERRVSDLRQLSGSIQRYFVDTQRLPPDLGTLVNGWVSTEVPRDPQTGQSYDYEIGDDRAYRLCAVFSRDAHADRQSDFWSHDEGRHCYAFDYSDIVFD